MPKQLFATDILKVLYAPHKVFKQIIQTPKYWGPLLVFVIFIAVQSGFYYGVNLKTYYEQTSPDINSNQLGAWTENPALWTVSPSVTVNSNYMDYMNSSTYGNSSLQFSVSNSTKISIELASFSNVDCGPSGFQNLSMRIKQVDPQTTPSSVTFTLYSLNKSNSFQRDLTADFSNASLIDVWNNITVPVGTNAANWQSSGSPQWGNITGLKLDFNFAANSSITLRMQGLFFRGVYATYTQITLSGFVINVLQLVVSQFLFQWLILTGLMYIIIKGLKGNIIWKPLFIAVGFASVVTIVQSLITIAAIPALPLVIYPVELYARLPVEAQVIGNALATQTETFNLIAEVVQLATYVWIVALGTFIIRALLPEFTWMKSILVSAATLIIRIILLYMFGF